MAARNWIFIDIRCFDAENLEVKYLHNILVCTIVIRCDDLLNQQHNSETDFLWLVFSIHSTSFDDDIYRIQPVHSEIYLFTKMNMENCTLTRIQIKLRFGLIQFRAFNEFSIQTRKHRKRINRRSWISLHTLAPSFTFLLHYMDTGSQFGCIGENWPGKAHLLCVNKHNERTAIITFLPR